MSGTKEHRDRDLVGMRLDDPTSLSRRRAASAALISLLAPPPRVLHAACPPELSAGEFKSTGFARPNYSSSIQASRDTNISPLEAYDVIAFKAEPPTSSSSACPRALDLGAGAGVSTQLLWKNGFRRITAVDISRTAWDDNVDEAKLPPGVTFTQANDNAFLDSFRAAAAPEPFDLVLVNYAINENKALEFAQTLLAEGGQLLAPVNQQRDFWFAQEFRLMDRSGSVLWRQAEVGTWAVTFQPDFTAPNCQGQWCPQFRGADSLSTLNLKGR